MARMAIAMFVGSILSVALAAIGLPASQAFAASDVAAHSRVIRVLSLNIHGLPFPVNTDHERFREIGQILRDRLQRDEGPDIVLLQEAFIDRTDELNLEAGYPYSREGHRRWDKLLSSGLVILSRHKITQTWRNTFNSCTVSDCFASKGVLAVNLEIDGVPYPLTIVTTHLQAQNENDSVRIQQIAELQDFYRDTQLFTRPHIFAGDFNMKPRHESYNYFLSTYPGKDAGSVCLETRSTCRLKLNHKIDVNEYWKSTNDRQFFYSPDSLPLSIQPVRLDRTFEEEVNGRTLSDHFGYEADYRLSW